MVDEMPPAASDGDRMDTWVKSYSYLRTAMVGLLIGIGVAVLYQTWRQDWTLLSSVSAYYYTPAQAIFVGALIGLGACMIALKGTTLAEEVLLNIGGMFAALVAVVPTSRGPDFESAVKACAEADSALLTERAAARADCPTTQALQAATRDNVDNNVWALLALGVLGLIGAVYFSRLDARRRRAALGPAFWWGMAAAVAVWAAAAATFTMSFTWFLKSAHGLAALGLFGCILAVTVVNAVRTEKDRTDTGPAEAHGPLQQAGSAMVRSPRKLDGYAVIAWVMIGVAVAGLFLLWREIISLFVLEIVVALLFAAFWLVQTVDRLPKDTAAAPARPPSADGRSQPRPT